MHNLETATLRLGIFHPHDSLSQTLIAAALQRRIEVSALQADLNSLRAHPGLHCKPASLASSIEVNQTVAGLGLLFAPLSDYTAETLSPIYAALIDGVPRTEVPRLLPFGHWQRLVALRDADEEQLSAGLEHNLTVSGLNQTLVEVPSLPTGLRIDDFSRVSDVTEVEAARVFTCAEVLLDEVRLGLHKHQCLCPAP